MPSSPTPLRVHYGIGGAGNVTSTTPTTHRRPSHHADIHPKSCPRRFTTGVGGHGNIVTASVPPNPQLHSLLATTSVPGLVLSCSPSSHYGIGGIGNVCSQSTTDLERAKRNNEGYVRERMSSVLNLKTGSDLGTAASDKEEQEGRSSMSSFGSLTGVVEEVREWLGARRFPRA